MLSFVRAFLLASLLFVFAPVAHAGPAEEKLAIELTRLVLPESQYDRMMDQMMSSMAASMTAASGKPMDAATTAKLKAVVAECVPYEEMVQWNAEIYGSRFTEAELHDLIAFYQTPTGQKLAAALPDISAEVGAKMGPILMQRMPAAMKKHGLQ